MFDQLPSVLHERILATSIVATNIKLWQLDKPDIQPHVFSGPKHEIYMVAFSPYGRILASGSQDTTINLWDAFDGELRYTRGRHNGAVYSSAFNPIELYFVGDGNDGEVRLWIY